MFIIINANIFCEKRGGGVLHACMHGIFSMGWTLVFCIIFCHAIRYRFCVYDYQCKHFLRKERGCTACMHACMVFFNGLEVMHV